MKIASLIARYLLGLIFLVFGLNGFLHFIPTPPPPGTAGQFMGALFVSNFLIVVFLLEIIPAVLLLLNRLLREVVLAGEIERGKVPAMVNLQERAARNVTSALLDKKLLVSTSSRAPLRLAFPTEAVERWFPSLYPAAER
jgi:hypothetical protein